MTAQRSGAGTNQYVKSTRPRPVVAVPSADEMLRTATATAGAAPSDAAARRAETDLAAMKALAEAWPGGPQFVDASETASPPPLASNAGRDLVRPPLNSAQRQMEDLIGPVDWDGIKVIQQTVGGMLSAEMDGRNTYMPPIPARQLDRLYEFLSRISALAD